MGSGWIWGAGRECRGGRGGSGVPGGWGGGAERHARLCNIMTLIDIFRHYSPDALLNIFIPPCILGTEICRLLSRNEENISARQNAGRRGEREATAAYDDIF